MLKKIIFTIKRKKELSSLEDEFVKRLILNYFKKNPKIKKKLDSHERFEKSKEFKIIIKEIRKTLHEVYGVFHLGSKRESFLKKLGKHLEKKGVDNEALKLHENILMTHRSTKERLDSYGFLYDLIFKNLKPKKILDLSSGLNPFSFPWMNLTKVEYIATELTKKDCDYVNNYFKVMKKFGLEGKTMQIDLLDLKTLPKSDFCFLFKLLDSLESLEKGISKKILEKIDAKKIVVSFPTTSIGGKRISKRRLVWFEKLLNEFETFEIGNEVFYIFEKTKIY